MTDEPKLWPEGKNSGNGPLKGVRVLDLTTVLMGPSATQILGDLGADVVKIEGLGGDTMRLIGPWRHEGMGALFLQANRNKRSVVIDLKTAQGKEAISRLAKQADVLVSNVRPQGLARLGLDYGSVSVQTIVSSIALPSDTAAMVHNPASRCMMISCKLRRALPDYFVRSMEHHVMRRSISATGSSASTSPMRSPVRCIIER